MGISGSKKRDTQTGEKALETSPFHYETRGVRGRERIDIFLTTLTSNLKRAHTKALECGCLSRSYLPPFNSNTISQGRGLVG